jgi:ATP phosphoribosyltransferase
VSAANADVLRFGVPTGKRFEGRAFGFLESCGLAVQREHDRQLMANVSGVPDALVLVQRARDILTQVTDGKIDVGITGMDLVEEYRTEGSDLFVLYEDLAFSTARVALAVPESWLDVSTLSDLADVAAALRERGEPLRVVTTFPRLTQRYLYARGITHFSIVPAEGGVEAAPGVGFGDVIVDIVETGISLRENRLKLIRNGTVLRSQACLVANRRALADNPRKRETTRQIVELIEARLRARDYFSVTANLRGASELEVARALLDAPATRGMRGPTVARVYTAQDTDGQERDEHWFAATIIVSADALQPAVDHLRSVGGSGMSVVPVRYLFDARSHVFEDAMRALGLAQGAPTPKLRQEAGRG